MDTPKALLLPRIQLSSTTATRAGTEITITEPGEWQHFTRLLELCDGSHTADQIAAKLSLDLDGIQDTLKALESVGFIWLLSDTRTIPISVFKAEFARWLPRWVDRMYDQPCWSELYKGQAPSTVLIGWALENMHYTQSVMSHMPIAVRYAEDAGDVAIQFKHLNEEWDHYRLFSAACQAANLSETLLRQGRPLPSTHSITLFMRHVAQQGVLVYNACEALLEATSENHQLVVDFYDKAGAQLGLPEIFIQKLVKHVMVDKDFEHILILDQLLERHRQLTAEVVTKIFAYCERLADIFELWHAEISEFYDLQKHSTAVRGQGRKMSEPTISSHGVPINLPPITLEGAALDVMSVIQIDSALNSTLSSIRGWLQGSVLLNEYHLSSYTANLAVEMCHIMAGLDKTIAQCAAEASDKNVQEMLIKCAFHFNRTRSTWNAVCHALTGKSMEELEPLTSTLLFQLALEELSKKDELAFAYAIDLFAPPGHESSIECIASYFEQLSNTPVIRSIISDWKKQSIDNSISYASLGTSKRYGYPTEGSYGSALAMLSGGILQRDLAKSLMSLITLGDQFHLFYRGAQISFHEKHEAFPHIKINWLNI